MLAVQLLVTGRCMALLRTVENALLASHTWPARRCRAKHEKGLLVPRGRRHVLDQGLKRGCSYVDQVEAVPITCNHEWEVLWVEAFHQSDTAAHLVLHLWILNHDESGRRLCHTFALRLLLRSRFALIIDDDLVLVCEQVSRLIKAKNDLTWRVLEHNCDIEALTQRDWLLYSVDELYNLLVRIDV